jgi:hypothetical protein
MQGKSYNAVATLKSEKRELFSHSIANGLNKTQAALNAGFSAKSAQCTGSTLSRDPMIIARVAELKAMVANATAKAVEESFSAALAEVPSRAAAFVAQAVRERQYRLTVIQDIVDRLRMVIDERAAAGRAMGEGAAPGAATGLLVRTLKSLREGKRSVIKEFWEIDGVTIQKLYDGLKQAAIEAGEWQEEGRVLPPATVDVSHLTPEQVLAEQRVLRRAKEEIEAIRTQKEPATLIEASAGSVEQVLPTEIEIEVGVEVSSGD